MHIVFGLHLDGLKPEVPQTVVGATTLGPKGLLEVLETQLGLPTPNPHPSEAPFSYLQGTVKFSGSVADLVNETRHAKLPRIPLSPRDHQPRRLAVSPLRCELSRCRRSSGPTRHHGVLRSDPAVVPHVRFSIRSPAQASAGPAGRHLAPGRGLRHHPGTAALSLACRRSRWRRPRYSRPVASRLPGCQTLFRKLLKGQESKPVRLVTDKLSSYRAAHRAVMPSVAHSTDRYANNRAEVSHQPTRQRERHMRRFKSPGQAQRFLTVHGLVRNLFRVGRHLVRAEHHRELRGRSFLIWDAVTLAA